MSADANVATVKGFYEAFGRGDVGTILAGLADDVDWAADTSSTAAPWYGVRHGKDQVTAFFTEFGGTMEVQEFTPVAFAANDDEVMAVVQFRAAPRATGKSVSMNLHHYFRFRDGKVVYYRGTEDTAQTEAALR
jgi:ketosteroid isomerase-like protein